MNREIIAQNLRDGESVEDLAVRLLDEVDALAQEASRLREVMAEAAREIDQQWDAHCDSDGYGPVNLMHRLENGLAAEYAPIAGAGNEPPAAVREALQRLIENGIAMGPTSADDALLVARFRRSLLGMSKQQAASSENGDSGA
ncbi:MAG: hypothetical protein LAT62_13400 [Natronospirillum sp.]|uniref:hypothetical protein n=1 Tax=Natronospirillum sp. TaxID=2812955 RepID=UPI0025E7F8F2|nr:hypothetical protein [Natronospirillum sp.]MCH8552929.1 hypothetical protein [Natronospirillum sp.]